MPEDKSILEKLKKILKMSERIRMEQLRDALNLGHSNFNENIFDWADEFGFIIDGDYINVQKNRVNDFIDTLDTQFESWNNYERGGIGKIEIPISKKLIINEESVKRSDDKVQESIRQKARILDKQKKGKAILNPLDFISFRGAEIPVFEAQIIQELENQTQDPHSGKKIELNLVNSVEWNFPNVFIVEHHRITGININDCCLKFLPESIGRLFLLKLLDLKNNQLTTLPQSIGNLLIGHRKRKKNQQSTRTGSTTRRLN